MILNFFKSSEDLWRRSFLRRHGVPTQLLDHGAAFLSRLLAEMYPLMRIKKVNTTAYHQQTDGLVERFNRSLLDMILGIQPTSWQGHGSYHVVHAIDNGVEVKPVDQPHVTPTHVALNRVRSCPVEMPDVFWPQRDALPLSQDLTIDFKKEPKPPVEPTPQQTEWTSRLQPRMRKS